MLGVEVDARIVGAVRGLIIAVIVAAGLAGLMFAQTELMSEPSISGAWWAPLAVAAIAWGIRTIEGFRDHADPARPG